LLSVASPENIPENIARQIFWISQIYLIFVTDSQSKSTLRTQTHEFGYNCAMKSVYKDNRSAAAKKGK
jgi:hypothetical protein